MKIFTLSFDDGVTQDRRFIELLKKYGLTCTFNVNSALLGTEGEVITGKNQSRVPHNKVEACEVASLYDGFEVAVHTRTHPMLTGLSDADILEQVVGDSVTLSSLAGYPVLGMAYPGGHPNYDRLVVDLLRKYTKIRYARTIVDTYSLEFPSDFLLWNPSAHILDGRADGLIDEFCAAQGDSLLYLWGHTYEMDVDDGWERAERVLSRLANIKDAVCMTNMQVWEYAHK